MMLRSFAVSTLAVESRATLAANGDSSQRVSISLPFIRLVPLSVRLKDLVCIEKVLFIDDCVPRRLDALGIAAPLVDFAKANIGRVR